MAAAWITAGHRLFTCCSPIWPADGERARQLGPWRLLRFLPRFLQAQWQLWQLRHDLTRADAIWVPFPGFMDLPLVAWLARRVRKPLIFDPFLSLSDSLVAERHWFTARSWQARWLRLMEAWLLERADIVLAETPQMAEWFAAIAPACQSRLVVVPVGVDALFLHPPRTEVSGPGFEVLWFGRPAPMHGREVIVTAWRHIPVDSRIYLHLIGGDRPTEAAPWPGDRVSLQHALDNGQRLFWEPEVPFAALPDTLDHARIVLGVFGTTPKAARVIPHKVFQAAARARCIITSDTLALRSMFTESDVCAVPPGNALILAQTILELASNEPRRTALASAAHTRVRQVTTADALVGALVQRLMSESGETSQ